MKRRDFLLKSTFAGLALATAAPVMDTVAEAAEGNVTLVKNGKAQCAIYAAPEVMADDKPVSNATPFEERQREMQRRRLRDSVMDIVYCMQRISGAEVKVLLRAPQKGDRQLPILIGEYAVGQW